MLFNHTDSRERHLRDGDCVINRAIVHYDHFERLLHVLLGERPKRICDGSGRV